MANFRHGDMGIFEINELPEGLKKSSRKVLLTGSHGHDHTFDKGEFYPVDDGQIIGYLVAKGTTLFHPEHGEEVKSGLRPAKIKDGIYRLIRQAEETNEGMRPVVD